MRIHLKMQFSVDAGAPELPTLFALLSKLDPHSSVVPGGSDFVEPVDQDDPTPVPILDDTGRLDLEQLERVADQAVATEPGGDGLVRVRVPNPIDPQTGKRRRGRPRIVKVDPDEVAQTVANSVIPTKSEVAVVEENPVPPPKFTAEPDRETLTTPTAPVIDLVPVEPPLTLDDVRSQLKQTMDSVGSDVARAVLKRLGVSRASDLDPKQYGRACRLFLEAREVVQ